MSRCPLWRWQQCPSSLRAHHTLAASSSIFLLQPARQPVRQVATGAGRVGSGDQRQVETYQPENNEASRLSLLDLRMSGVNLTRREQWHLRLEEVQQCVAQYGRLPSRSAGEPLGYWVHNQRQQYKAYQQGKRSSMTPECIAALEAVPGWEWGVWGVDWEAQWQARLEEVQQYVAQHGRPPPQTAGALGRWVNTQRKEYKAWQQGKRSSMTPERIAALEAVPGWEWGVDWEAQWQARLEELQQYMAQHGRPPPQTAGPLGIWVTTQCTQYKAWQQGKRSSMTPERIAALEAVPGWEWGLDWEAQWHLRQEEVQQYVAQHGRCRLDQLGRWATGCTTSVSSTRPTSRASAAA